MLFAVSILSAVLLLLMLVQIVWANQFVNLYRNSHRPQKDIQYPHVGVIMSLRGADPFLEESLRGLMSLDYPSHEVRIIVDSEIDPAYDIVDRVHQDMNCDNVNIEILNVSQQTSSLKNSALIQGITALPHVRMPAKPTRG